MTEGKAGFSGIALDSREGKLTLIALVMIFYTISLFISVAIHEVLGHGLASTLVGGKFYAVYISPGSGYISFALPDSIGVKAAAFVYLAGITIEIICGAILLFLIVPRLKGFTIRLFGIVLSGVLLIHSSLYLLLGSFYAPGDSYQAAYILGIAPDLFVITGLILVGVFSLAVSMAAIGHLGRHMDLSDERVKANTLLQFWLPAILLGLASGFVSLFLLEKSMPSYALANAVLLLLFISAAVAMVPRMHESGEFVPHRQDMKKVMAALACFFVVVAVWLGAFGPTDATAHGLLLREPPLEVEGYYSDSTIGNIEITVYQNQTMKMAVSLRNQLNDPSPLDDKIFHTFDNRPNWEYYDARARYILASMFNLSREVNENLSFEYSMGTAYGLGSEIDHARVCTTYVNISAGNTTRAPFSITYGVVTGGIEEDDEDRIIIGFIDPWATQGGFLDRVTFSWGENLTLLGYTAQNYTGAHVRNTEGGTDQGTLIWKTNDYQSAPVLYRLTLQKGQGK
jgi:hypothetical protein